MSNVAINIAAEFTGKKAFAQADKSVNGFEKSVKKLAKQFAGLFAAKKVLDFGKASVKAFAEDQKAATRLATAVKNLGLEFSNPAIASYIDKLTIASGVSDTQLRPALQALLTTTGDLTGSQKLLSEAIDISAGSGVELTQVAQDLANAYIGKTKALTKYNLGLTQAELKTAKFTDLQKKLNDQYSGANAAYLGTYAGKMQLLANAAGEAQEKIGGALVDALMSLSGSMSVQDLIDKMDILADKTVGWIDQMTEGLLEIQAIAKQFSLKNLFSLKFDPKELDRAIQSAQVDSYNKKLRRNYMKAWEGIKTPEQIAQEKKAAADAAKRAKELVAAQNKQTAELKKQAALKKAQSIFDMQNIQLVAALKGQLTEDEKNRVKALLALNNDNVDAAKYYSDLVIKAQDKTGELANFIRTLPDAKNPFAYLDEWLVKFQQKLDALRFPSMVTVAPISGAVQGYIPSVNYPAGLRPGDPGFVGPTIPSTNVPSGTPVQNFIPDTSIYGNPSGTQMGPQPIQIQVSGSDSLTKAIADSLQVQSLSGIPSSVQRLVSTFG